MLNFSKHIFVVSLFLAIFNHASFAAQYSEEERSAAINAGNHKKQTLQALQDCSSFHIGPASNYFKFLEYLWAHNNEPISMAAEEVLAISPSDAKRATDGATTHKIAPAAAPASASGSTEGLGATVNPQVCDALSKKTRSLQLDFRNAYPADAKLLSAIFDTNNAWKIKIRNDNFTVGCVKSYWSRDEKDFEAVKSSCDCQTAILLKTGSEPQISAWVTDIGQIGAAAASSKESNSWLRSVMKQTAELCSW
jgi:hypothetical protein